MTHNKEEHLVRGKPPLAPVHRDPGEEVTDVRGRLSTFTSNVSSAAGPPLTHLCIPGCLFSPVEKLQKPLFIRIMSHTVWLQSVCMFLKCINTNVIVNNDGFQV